MEAIIAEGTTILAGVDRAGQDGVVELRFRRRGLAISLGAILLLLLALQITLGALTVLSGKQFIINSLHVVTGACVLVTSLVLTLRTHRARFAVTAEARPRAAAPLHTRSAGAHA